MSSQTWALVGVVVGAVLGGGGQIVADHLKRRTDARMTARAERREAYTEFSGAAMEAIGPYRLAQPILGAPVSPPEAHPQTRDHLVSSQAALHRSALALARVNLLAPEDTHWAALQVNAAAMTFLLSEDEEGQVEAFAKNQTSFILLAKRDLAL